MEYCYGCRSLEYDYLISEGVGGKGGNRFIFVNDLKINPMTQIKWDTNKHGIAYIGMGNYYRDVQNWQFR